MNDPLENLIVPSVISSEIKVEDTCTFLDINLINFYVESSEEIPREVWLDDSFQKTRESKNFNDDSGDETVDEINNDMNIPLCHYYTFPVGNYLQWLFHSGFMPNWQLYLLTSHPNSCFGYGWWTSCANTENNQKILTKANIVYRQYTSCINKSILLEDELVLSNITACDYNVVITVKSSNSHDVNFVTQFKEFIRRFEKITSLQIKRNQLNTLNIQKFINYTIEPVNGAVKLQWI
jgi:hypothetical protein